ncbi:methyltransferase domain-containing protein [Paracoccus sp. S-4012]|uniref:class I SAM-dependent methyltransferase n=1 Tax=Paracoccus sp. S-4012 TaxID=2665648 RepID=UPI0012AFE76D|nr:methyltransferase domain-containing protein [Paracoccus sp. S-4012]MRX51489.1 methyltransferase domain-containing protein [Paracoccus sp. S-4012]
MNAAPPASVEPPPAIAFTALCPICAKPRRFEAADDFFAPRDALTAPDCELNGCVTRERALAATLFSVYPRGEVRRMRVHEAAPGGRGISLWLHQNVGGLVLTGYFPDQPFGDMVGHVRNEDLEAQTFEDECFDLVVHLDVMEHLFHPFRALTEIYRTLRPGGLCLFTAPTYGGRETSEQVAFLEDGAVRIVGEPEYHGNPQGDGSLVTWRYGYDLPLLIARQTGFDVEVRRWQSPSIAVMGRMTEVYLLRRPLRTAETDTRDSE